MLRAGGAVRVALPAVCERVLQAGAALGVRGGGGRLRRTVRRGAVMRWVATGGGGSGGGTVDRVRCIDGRSLGSTLGAGGMKRGFNRGTAAYSCVSVVAVRRF